MRTFRIWGSLVLAYKALSLHRLSCEPLVAVDGDFPRGLAGVALLAFAALVGVIDARSVPIDRVRSSLRIKGGDQSKRLAWSDQSWSDLEKISQPNSRAM